MEWRLGGREIERKDGMEVGMKGKERMKRRLGGRGKTGSSGGWEEGKRKD